MRILNNSFQNDHPHSIHLGVSFDRLAAFRTALSKIDLQERADSESAALSELDQQRDTLFNVTDSLKCEKNRKK